jgi:hypothetical protein
MTDVQSSHILVHSYRCFKYAKTDSMWIVATTGVAVRWRVLLVVNVPLAINSVNYPVSLLFPLQRLYLFQSLLLLLLLLLVLLLELLELHYFLFDNLQRCLEQIKPRRPSVHVLFNIGLLGYQAWHSGIVVVGCCITTTIIANHH